MKKSTLFASLITLLCCAQPAFSQQFESDEDWQKQAAQQIKAQSTPAVRKGKAQPANWGKAPVSRGAGYPAAARRSSNFGSGGYGFRPSRGGMRSSYGYRPQREDLMSPAEKQHMAQMRARLQRMQQMMGGMAGGGMPGGMGGGMGAMGGGMGQGMGMGGGMGGGMGMGGGKPNMLQMLMGGGGAAGQPQMPAQGGQGAMLKNLFGGGGAGGGGFGE